MRHKAKDHKKVEDLDETNQKLLGKKWLHVVKKELFKVLLVFLHLNQLQVSQKYVLLIKHWVRQNSDYIKDEGVFQIDLGSLKWFSDLDLVLDKAFREKLENDVENLNGDDESVKFLVVNEILDQDISVHMFWCLMMFRSITV